MRKKYVEQENVAMDNKGTMFFNACYYGIEMYQPSKIGFIGCDMDYEQYSEGEDNAFFGVFVSISRNFWPKIFQH